MEAAKLLEASSDAPCLEAMTEAYRLLLRRSDADELYRSYRRILGPDDAAIKRTEACLERTIGSRRALIFEGAQGALLDRTRGFLPHVTKSDTTCRNALDLLEALSPRRKPHKLGILRAYGHRHGAGPFVTEDESLRERFDDPLNRRNAWQGAFRVGWLELPALRYGIRLNGGVDGLALTGLDRLDGSETIRLCASYKDARGGSHAVTVPHCVSVPSAATS